MTTWRLLLPLVLLVASWGILEPTAMAGGRAFCALSFGLESRTRCIVEQTLFASGPFEVAAGTFIEPHRSWIPVPYTALLWLEQSWWLTIEFGKHLDSPAFFFRLFGGIRW